MEQGYLAVLLAGTFLGTALALFVMMMKGARPFELIFLLGLEGVAIYFAAGDPGLLYVGLASGALAILGILGTVFKLPWK